MALLVADVSARVGVKKSDIQDLVDYMEVNTLEALSLVDIQALKDAATITFDPTTIEFVTRNGLAVPLGPLHPHIQYVELRPSDRENSDIWLSYKRLDFELSIPLDGTDQDFDAWDNAPIGGSGSDQGVGK